MPHPRAWNIYLYWLYLQMHNGLSLLTMLRIYSVPVPCSRGTIWMVQWWHLTVSNARRKECAGAYQCLRPFPLHLRITRLTPLRLQLQLVRFHHLLEVQLIMLHLLLLWCWTIHQTTRSVLRHGLNITSWS